MSEVQLDRVEAGVDRHLGGITELIDHHGDLAARDRPAVRERGRVDEPARSHRRHTRELLLGDDARVPSCAEIAAPAPCTASVSLRRPGNALAFITICPGALAA